MNMKKLVGMVVALLVLAGVVVLQKQSTRGPQAVRKGHGQTLMQGIDLNRIDGLEIQEGSNSVRLVRQEGRWKVESLYGYAADFSKLSDAVQKCAEVKLGSAVRSANIADAEYGLDAAKIIAFKQGDESVATIEVGARREASESAGWANQYFVRKEGEASIYLVDYHFRPFSAVSAEWIETELLNVRSTDLVSVSVGDVELKLDGADWTLEGLDSETEVLQTAEAGKLRNALQYLNCTSVADPSISAEELGFADARVYTAQTTNQTYTVELGGEAEAGRYLRLSGDVAEQLKPWVYIVPDYKTANFMVDRDALVKPKGEPAEGEE